MLVFDQTHQYQFSLFLDGRLPPADIVRTLGPHLARASKSETNSLGLKLGPPEFSQTVLMGPEGTSPDPTVTWKAGSGVWRAVWTPSRLDMHFDVRGYNDLTDGKVTLSQIRQRVVPNLMEVSELLDQGVLRLALIVTAQAATLPKPLRATRIVAATFFNSKLAEAEEKGLLADPVGRVNHITDWDLELGSKTRINRNETGSAVSVIRNGLEETGLTLQWDVNTSPTTDAKSFPPNAIASFFQRSEAWVNERLEAVLSIK